MAWQKNKNVVRGVTFYICIFFTFNWVKNCSIFFYTIICASVSVTNVLLPPLPLWIFTPASPEDWTQSVKWSLNWLLLCPDHEERFWVVPWLHRCIQKKVNSPITHHKEFPSSFINHENLLKVFYTVFYLL